MTIGILMVEGDIMSKKGTVRVERVELLREGVFNGHTVDAKMLRQVVDNYDLEFLSAKLSRDHAQVGSANDGFVSSLYLDKGKVWGDYDNVPEDHAKEMLPGGDWCGRSCEIAQNLDGKGAYLIAVTQLGVHMPAIRGMKDIQESQIKTQDLVPAVSLSEGGDILTFSLSAEKPPLVISPQGGTTMAGDKDAIKLAEERDAELKVLKEENIKLKERDAAKDEQAIILLQDENALLKLDQAKRDAEEFVKTDLKDIASPAMLRAGIVELLQFADCMDENQVIKLADGEKSIKFGEQLRTFCKSIPVLPGKTEIAPADKEDTTGVIALSENLKELSKANRQNPEEVMKFVAENQEAIQIGRKVYEWRA